MFTKLLFTALLLCICPSSVLSYKILVVCPIPGRSHNMLGKGIADILHSAKHEVTFITGFPNDKAKYRELSVDFDLSKLNDLILKFDTMAKQSILSTIFKLPKIMNKLMEATFTSKAVKSVLNDENEKFDLVIVEYFFNQGFVGLGVKYNCPVIMLSPVSPIHWLARMTDNPISPSTIPNIFLSSGGKMNFGQRILNTVMAIFQEFFGSAFADRYQEISYNTYLPEEAARVPFSKLHEKIALVFSNSHPSIVPARPFLPNVVEIAGYHISDNKTLPEEYKKIMDNAKNGVIFFSMGSNLKSAEMPQELKTDILKALSKRKETVLWKYEEDLPIKPKNVIIRSWMPQSSILTHPNLKVFITHGGFLSTTEAASAGIPVLAIPIYGDQFTNARSTQERGCGVVLEYTNVTEASLTWALEEVISNPSYTETAKSTHRAFHDRFMSPKESVVFYTEHVIRTGGAKHLSGPHLPLYSSLLLDVIAVLMLPPLILLMATIWMCKKCCRKSTKRINTKGKQKTH